MTPLAAQILSLLSLSPEYLFTKHISGSWLPYECIPAYLVHPKGGARHSVVQSSVDSKVGSAPLPRSQWLIAWIFFSFESSLSFFSFKIP